MQSGCDSIHIRLTRSKCDSRPILQRIKLKSILSLKLNLIVPSLEQQSYLLR